MCIPVIDLFSGAGGLSSGLIRAGFEVRAAVEIDSEAIETYTYNIGDIVLDKNIKEVSGAQILKKANLKKGDMFLLAGCPPCQGFSSVGPRNKNDERNQLVFDFVRLINETKPWFILMENVAGMTKGFGKNIFKKACDQLEKEYLIKSQVVNTANYGVPQSRKRLVLHGIRKDIYKKYFPKDYEFEMPPETHEDKNSLSNNSKQSWTTVAIINDLPPIAVGSRDETIPNHTCMKLIDKNIERIRNTPHDGGSRSDWPVELRLACHKDNVGYKDVYGRMDSNSLAPTITAGCLAYSKGRFGHPTQDRAISAREAARLQTFDDNYVFFGSLSNIGKQIGNAVPPKLAEASGNHIVDMIRTYIYKTDSQK